MKICLHLLAIQPNEKKNFKGDRGKIGSNGEKVNGLT